MHHSAIPEGRAAAQLNIVRHGNRKILIAPVSTKAPNLAANIPIANQADSPINEQSGQDYPEIREHVVRR